MSGDRYCVGVDFANDFRLRLNPQPLANIHQLSKPHIVKIVHELDKAGYLETIRGRNGGFRLSRPAKSIVVGGVVRITEGPLDVVECFNQETNTCPLINVCKQCAAVLVNILVCRYSFYSARTKKQRP
jgi:Rrf2 family protein